MAIKCFLTLQLFLHCNRKDKLFILVHREDSGNWNGCWRYEVLDHAEEIQQAVKKPLSSWDHLILAAYGLQY